MTTLDAIEKTVELAQPIERVWRAITDPKELAQWFPNDSATLDVVPGGEGVFTWDFGEERFRTEIHVLAVNPPHRFVWTWGNEADSDEPATQVEWMLTEREDGGTTLLIRESGFLDEKHRTGNVQGWDEESAELVAHLAH